jgi:hypothetical protein
MKTIDIYFSFTLTLLSATCIYIGQTVPHYQTIGAILILVGGVVGFINIYSLVKECENESN